MELKHVLWKKLPINQFHSTTVQSISFGTMALQTQVSQKSLSFLDIFFLHFEAQSSQSRLPLCMQQDMFPVIFWTAQLQILEVEVSQDIVKPVTSQTVITSARMILDKWIYVNLSLIVVLPGQRHKQRQRQTESLKFQKDGISAPSGTIHRRSPPWAREHRWHRNAPCRRGWRPGVTGMQRNNMKSW